MNRRALYAGIGILVLAAAAAAALISPVYADRGRDEAFYLTVHALPMTPGVPVTQQVPLQRPEATAIEVPYRWLGAQPATVDVRLTNPDGSLIFERRELFANSRGSKTLQPTGNGSVWQDLLAEFKTISLPPGLSGTVGLSLTRVDQSDGTLFLFASDALSPRSDAGLGTRPDQRPAIVGRDGEVLDVETEYGALQPAAVKLPTYLSRIASIGPPWIAAPIFVLLFVALVLIAMFLYALLVMTPETKPESGGPDLAE